MPASYLHLLSEHFRLRIKHPKQKNVTADVKTGKSVHAKTANVTADAKMANLVTARKIQNLTVSAKITKKTRKIKRAAVATNLSPLILI